MNSYKIIMYSNLIKARKFWGNEIYFLFGNFFNELSFI